MHDKYSVRDYRGKYGKSELIFFNVIYEHTDLSIGCKADLSKEAMSAVLDIRKRIEAEITDNPNFLITMTPLKTPMICDEYIRLMYEAAIIADVGPMAAVAGCVSYYVGERLNKYSKDVIVENGGDDYIITTKKRTIAIIAGDSPLSGKIGFKLLPGRWGVCTSAGRVGPSISKGDSHAATIISKSPILSDAVATAMGNRIKMEEDLESSIKWAVNLQGVLGAIGIINDKIAVGGDIKLLPISN